MNCAESDELVGAYAIDALPADEAAAFRAHIASCENHAAQAAEMRSITRSLAATVEPLPPPAALRARVLDAIAREPQAGIAVAPRAIATAPSARPSTGIQSRPLSRVRPRPAYAWGALAAAIIAGLLAWNIVLQASDDGGDARYAATNATTVSTLQAHDASGTGTALYFADEKKIVVIAGGVDRLDRTRTYQFWAIDGGQPVSLGTARPDERGRISSVLNFDAAEASTFAVTIEPAGGSPQPTSDPVFTAEVPL